MRIPRFLHIAVLVAMVGAGLIGPSAYAFEQTGGAYTSGLVQQKPADKQQPAKPAAAKNDEKPGNATQAEKPQEPAKPAAAKNDDKPGNATQPEKPHEPAKPAAAKNDDKPGNTQGNSQSNPDGGGVDKPYPADGQGANTQQNPVNTSIYSDGNNGCGQDKKVEPREDDFGQKHQGWDDNQGWCGKPNEKVAGTDATPTSTKTSVPPTDNANSSATPTDTPVLTEVAGEQATPTISDTPTSTPVLTEVAGEQATPTGNDTPTNTPALTAVADEQATPTGSDTPTSTPVVEGDTVVPVVSPGATGDIVILGPGREPVPPPSLADVQPGDIDEPTAGAIAEVIGGDTTADEIQQLSGPQIAALAQAAGVSVATIEALLGESVRRDVIGEAAVEAVLGTQARRTFENVVAGAMSSTGGAPIGLIAVGLAAFAAIGFALRRYGRRSI